MRFPDPGEVLDGYTLYLPTSYETVQQDFPVIVFLQGSGAVGDDLERVNIDGVPWVMIEGEGVPPDEHRWLLDTFVVVCPHIRRGQYYDQAGGIARLLDEVADSYRVDRSRIYLTGLSRGGHGTWGLAARLPETFAAIAPFGGGIHGVEDFSPLAGTPVWIAHNTRDHMVSVAESEKAVRELESRDPTRFLRLDSAVAPLGETLRHPRIFTSADRRGHNSWTEMYASSDFYHWLLAHRRDG